jgi:hypothetical protein
MTRKKRRSNQAGNQKFRHPFYRTIDRVVFKQEAEIINRTRYNCAPALGAKIKVLLNPLEFPLW